MVIIIVLAVAMIGLMFWNTRKQKQQREEVQKMRDSFAPGMLVRTNSGFLGTIEQVDSDSVVIRSEDGSLSRWMTEAISLRTNSTPANASQLTDNRSAIEDKSDDASVGSETSGTDSKASVTASETESTAPAKITSAAVAGAAPEEESAVEVPSSSAKVRKTSKTTAKAASKTSAKRTTKKSSSPANNQS
jgi:preprotein translocase subunit YajC